MTTNMKPADELLSVRQKIKALEAREAELKAGLQSGAMDLAGDFAVATVTVSKRKTFNRKAAEVELGSLARFETEGEVTTIRVVELERPVA